MHEVSVVYRTTQTFGFELKYTVVLTILPVRIIFLSFSMGVGVSLGP
jgi:hypothetical protein